MKMYKPHLMKKIFIPALLIIALVNCVNGQSTQDTESPFLDIPPLTEIIDTAILYSPMLKAQRKVIEGIEEEMKVERKKWMDHIYIEGATNYGIYDNLVVNSISNNVDVSTGIITRNEQLRYYGGVSLKLPISAISSSSNNVKIKRMRKEQAGYEMQQIKEDIKQVIIEEYFQLKYLQESMNTYNKITQTLEISLLKAEKDLINGQMDFDDYGILVSTTGKSKADYLKAKNSFYAQYNKLESLSGLTFNP